MYWLYSARWGAFTPLGGSCRRETEDRGFSLELGAKEVANGKVSASSEAVCTAVSG